MGEVNASKDVACPLLFAALTGPLGPRPRGPSLAIWDLFARPLGATEVSRSPAVPQPFTNSVMSRSSSEVRAETLSIVTGLSSHA